MVRLFRPSMKFLVIICALGMIITILLFQNSNFRPEVLESKGSKAVLRNHSILIQNDPVTRVNCAKLFNKDAKEQTKALTFQSYHGFLSPDKYFTFIDCKKFVADRKYITDPMTQEEKDFPIAYSLVVFKELGQVERLFRAIYRPQNAYCFHVDLKSSKDFKDGLERLISCFPNVIISSRSVDVEWGRWSVLEADLICMQDLLKHFPKWKYLINLTGQEFPLRTNLELVRILKIFNGSNSIEGTLKRLNVGRAPKENPGFKVTWLKGSLHITAVRAFIEFIFKSNEVKVIKKLLHDKYFADETFFSTLNHNPQLGTPGAYLGEPETHGETYPFITRLKNWGDGPFNYPCESQLRVRQICIWGIKDLPFIDSRPELFINKLYWHFQPFTLDCLEERIFNHTQRDYDKTSGGRPLDLSYYRKLSFVKNHQ